MLGEGAAIDPVSHELRAPCDGEVISIAAARHAIALRAPGGAEILVHVGIDTVELGGEGFRCMVRKGDRVRAGDVLLSFDLDQVARKARSLITPVIVTNGERFRVVRAQRRSRGCHRRCVVRNRGDRAPVHDAGAARLSAPVVSEARGRGTRARHPCASRPALIARVAKALPYELECARAAAAPMRAAPWR